jgi:D-glycero-D-manno-heptose 1,7-bisphosphate phosphatase
VTNQPAAAKGKTTLRNLKEVHQKVIELSEAEGAQILSSHICFHRSEDICECRKPKVKLLEAAFEENPRFDRNNSWMVGDGVHDIQAGQALGLKTAFIGSNKWDIKKVFEDKDLYPTLWIENLMEFAEIICRRKI